MQAQSKHLYMILSTITSLALFLAMAGASLFAQSSPARAIGIDRPFVAHPMYVQPVIRQLPQSLPSNPGGPAPKTVQFPCQSNDHPQPMLCYGPYQVRQAYGVTDLLAKNISGQGSTIAVIDAYGSSTIEKDLKTFDLHWGIPDSKLNVITPYGTKANDTSWVPEVSVDVEWAHVMAPSATINLIIAKSSDDVDLYYALKYVVDHDLGDVISLSYGENESCADSRLRAAEHQVLVKATQKRMTVLAATGDFGSAQYTCDNATFQQAVSFPADDPLITAVGGTTLNADAVTGKYISESAWNESDAFNKASGGGFSNYFKRPGYQDAVTGKMSGRALPDISINASINGGVLVYQTGGLPNSPSITVIGGTSVGAPELAGIIADGVQMAGHRLGQINPALYQLGLSKNYPLLMNGITSGHNILLTSNIPGYGAHSGWNPVTGWGSPKQVEPFLKALIGAPESSPAPAPPGGVTPTPPPSNGSTPNNPAPTPGSGCKPTNPTPTPGKLSNHAPTPVSGSKLSNPTPTPTSISKLA